MTTTAAPPVRAGATPEIAYRPGQRLEGFVFRGVSPLLGLRAVAYQIEHERTGARILHVHSGDSENLFSVAFPTPPADDTGLPHILEHAVLGGSKRFPVKEPFFEMIKMSMATFINAMTSSLHTMYPVASNVRRDFFNLAEVYWDAVFHPELTEDTFRREGHHFTLADHADPAGELRIKGIVYNEMKGAYSNPESRVWRDATRGLFPDTPLARDSGGDPEAIPDLTYADFKRFHAAHYQPGNAYIFLYGDIPTADHLDFLKDRLAALEPREAPPVPSRQPRWSAPRSVRRGYPVQAGDDTREKTYFTLGWVVGDATDPAASTAWSALGAILLGNDAAPLRKALIDSKLGAAVFYAGAGSSGAEATFHVGLKGSEPDRAEAFLDLVLATLRRVADEGTPADRVEAAFQQLGYQHLEIQTLFPLRLMYAAHATWLLGADPLAFLRMDEHLAACRREFDADPAMFTRMIRERLLENPHRLLLVAAPDPAMQPAAEAAFARRMRERRASMSGDELRAIGRTAAALEEAQGRPNPPEALAKLPQLRVADLPPRPRHIPTTVETLRSGVELLRNEVFANGVSYLHLSLGLEALPPDLQPTLTFYESVFGKVGAAGQPYTRVAERRSACTGGLGCAQEFFPHAVEPGLMLRRMNFSLKTLDAQIGEALALLDDLLFRLEPGDLDRLRALVDQARAWYRTAAVSDSMGTASRHVARGFGPEPYAYHLAYGLPMVRRIEALASRFDAEAAGLVERLDAVRECLLTRGRWVASFTGSDAAYERVRAALEGWAGRPEREPVRQPPPAFEPYAAPPREGLAAPVQVAFCAAAMPAPPGGHPDAPLLDLGGRFVSMEYMLNEVRFKGNAYGGGCAYNEFHRTFDFYSYRDPRPAGTLAAIRGTKDFVAAADWSPAQIDRAIIGSAKHAERPIRPAEATGTALRRHLRGDAPDRREARYAALLRATPAEVKRVLLKQFEANEDRTAVCVLASREKLEEVNRQLPGAELAIEDVGKS